MVPWQEDAVALQFVCVCRNVGKFVPYGLVQTLFGFSTGKKTNVFFSKEKIAACNLWIVVRRKIQTREKESANLFTIWAMGEVSVDRSCLAKS